MYYSREYPSRVAQITSDLYKIFSKNHISMLDKYRLLVSYIVITFKNFGYRRKYLGFLNYSMQNFLGYTILIPNYYSFYIQFKECFIDEVYLFKTRKRSPHILDCGANIGMSILYFKWIYPESKIVAFEPSPSTVYFLRENIKQLSGVTLKNLGVSGKDGEVIFYNDKERPGLSTYKKGILKERLNSVEKIKVSTVRLSPFIEMEIDMLKLDIEGMELEVLREIADKLDLINNISMEYHKVEGNMLSDNISILEKAYALYCIQGNFMHSVYRGIRAKER